MYHSKMPPKPEWDDYLKNRWQARRHALSNRFEVGKEARRVLKEAQRELSRKDLNHRVGTKWLSKSRVDDYAERSELVEQVRSAYAWVCANKESIKNCRLLLDYDKFEKDNNVCERCHQTGFGLYNRSSRQVMCDDCHSDWLGDQ